MMPDSSTDPGDSPVRDTGQVAGWLVWHAMPTEDGAPMPRVRSACAPATANPRST
jgi:hypothetical protein